MRNHENAMRKIRASTPNGTATPMAILAPEDSPGSEGAGIGVIAGSGITDEDEIAGGCEDWSEALVRVF